jgi:hypothetical protein
MHEESCLPDANENAAPSTQSDAANDPLPYAIELTTVALNMLPLACGQALDARDIGTLTHAQKDLAEWPPFAPVNALVGEALGKSPQTEEAKAAARAAFDATVALVPDFMRPLVIESYIGDEKEVECTQ